MSNISELAESAVETKEELVVNLRRVISDAEDLLAATAGQTDSKIAELRARARQNLSVARQAGRGRRRPARQRPSCRHRHRRVRARQPLVVDRRRGGSRHADRRAVGPPLNRPGRLDAVNPRPEGAATRVRGLFADLLELAQVRL